MVGGVEESYLVISSSSFRYICKCQILHQKKTSLSNTMQSEYTDQYKSMGTDSDLHDNRVSLQERTFSL